MILLGILIGLFATKWNVTECYVARSCNQISSQQNEQCIPGFPTGVENIGGTLQNLMRGA